MSMKLFVWANPYDVSYGTSGLFVVANDLDEARTLAATGKRYSYVEFEERSEGDMSRIALGEPTRVVDLPCAEWHEWSE